jgi:hypothetical protein
MSKPEEKAVKIYSFPQKVVSEWIPGHPLIQQVFGIMDYQQYADTFVHGELKELIECLTASVLSKKDVLHTFSEFYDLLFFLSELAKRQKSEIDMYTAVSSMNGQGSESKRYEQVVGLVGSISTTNGETSGHTEAVTLIMSLVYHTLLERGVHLSKEQFVQMLEQSILPLFTKIDRNRPVFFYDCYAIESITGKKVDPLSAFKVSDDILRFLRQNICDPLPISIENSPQVRELARRSWILGKLDFVHAQESHPW